MADHDEALDDIFGGIEADGAAATADAGELGAKLDDVFDMLEQEAAIALPPTATPSSVLTATPSALAARPLPAAGDREAAPDAPAAASLAAQGASPPSDAVASSIAVPAAAPASAVPAAASAAAPAASTPAFTSVAASGSESGESMGLPPVPASASAAEESALPMGRPEDDGAATDASDAPPPPTAPAPDAPPTAALEPPKPRRRVPASPLLPLLRPWSAEGMAGLATALSAAPPDADTVLRLCAAHGSIPAQHRALAWQVLLGLSPTDGTDPSAPTAPPSGPPATTSSSPLDAAALEALRRDVAALFRSFDAADVKASGQKPSLGQEDAAKLVAGLCAARGAPYSPLACKVLGPLLFLGLPRPAVARVLGALVDRCLPDLLRPAMPVQGEQDLSLPGEAPGASPPPGPSLLPARLQQLHDHLRTIVVYHDAELVSGLDRVYPGWHRPSKLGASSSSAASAAAPAAAAGCVPVSWLGAAFCGAAAPHVIHGLLDRLIVFSASPGSDAPSPGPGSPSPCDAHAASPCSDASFSLLLLAAAVLLREAPSLKVICATNSGGSGAAGSGAESVSLPSSASAGGRALGGGGSAGVAGSASNASYLIGLTLDGALKRCLAPPPIDLASPAPPAPTTGPPSDAFTEPIASWLAAAVTLSRGTPPSFGQFLRTGPSGSNGTRPTPRAQLLSPAGLEVIRVPARPVAAQLVYGWKKVHDAATEASAATMAHGDVAHGAEEGGDGSTGTVEVDEAAPVSMLPSGELGGVSNTTLFPVRYLVVDCRPVVHRQAGRFATAFHVDPRTCRAAAVAVAADESASVLATAGAAEAAAPAAAAAAVPAAEGGGTARLAPAAPPPSAAPLQPVEAAPLPPAPGTSLPPLTRAEDDDSADDGLPAPDAQHPAAASSAEGIPLPQAVRELLALSGALHFTVLGVGAHHISAAYEPAVLQACIRQDGARVASVVRALVGAGCKHVSVVDGGFAALHAVVRQGTARGLVAGGGPPVPGSPSAASPEDVTYLHRSALVDHRPRACPVCRHLAVTRILGGGAAGFPPGHGAPSEAPSAPNAPGGGSAPSRAVKALAGAWTSLERALAGDPDPGAEGDTPEGLLSSPSSWDLHSALTAEERLSHRAGSIQAELDKWVAARNAAVSRALGMIRSEGSGSGSFRFGGKGGAAAEGEPGSVGAAVAAAAARGGGEEATAAAAPPSASSQAAVQVQAAVISGLSKARSALATVLAPPPSSATAAAGGAAGGSAPPAPSKQAPSSRPSSGSSATGASVEAAASSAPESSSEAAATATVSAPSSSSAPSWRDAAAARLREVAQQAEAAARAFAAAAAAPQPSGAGASSAPSPAPDGAAAAAPAAETPASAEGGDSTETTRPPAPVPPPQAAPSQAQLQREALGRQASAAASSARAVLSSGFFGLKTRISSGIAAATAPAPAPPSGGGFTLGQALSNASALDRSRKAATKKSTAPGGGAGGGAGAGRPGSGAAPRSLGAVLLLELAGLQKGADFDIERWSAFDGIQLYFAEKEKEAPAGWEGGAPPSPSPQPKPSPIVIEEEEEEEGGKASRALGADAVSAPVAPAPAPAFIRVQRLLCLACERVLVLDPSASAEGHAVVKSNHHVSELARLSFSRKKAGRISLFYRQQQMTGGAGGGERAVGEQQVVLRQRTYYVDLAEELIAGLQAAAAHMQ